MSFLSFVGSENLWGKFRFDSLYSSRFSSTQPQCTKNYSLPLKVRDTCFNVRGFSVAHVEFRLVLRTNCNKSFPKHREETELVSSGGPTRLLLGRNADTDC